jgi:Uma2 family endonuclease
MRPVSYNISLSISGIVMTPIAQAHSHYDIVSRLPEASEVTFHHVSWEDYEKLLDQVAEASGLRISYDNGALQIMTLSTAHENYERFIEALVRQVSLRLRIKLRSFGSATMRKRQKRAGKEPDCCFYVQTAAALGNRMQLDFSVDPPPDIAVEIDLYHDSRAKFPIYVALGVPELWRFDGYALTIFQLQEGRYLEQESSRALPCLTSQLLTDYLARLTTVGEFESLLAFDEWLQTLSSVPHS